MVHLITGFLCERFHWRKQERELLVDRKIKTDVYLIVMNEEEIIEKGVIRK